MMGSKSDLETMKPAAKILPEAGPGGRGARAVGAPHARGDRRRSSRTPVRRGVKAFICGAGGAAHLAGAVAAHTTRPVIGVPIANGALSGFDSLLSTVQMPPGMPVATVAVDGAENAGLLAAQIVALADPALAAKVEEERAARRKKVLESDAEVRARDARPDAGLGRATSSAAVAALRRGEVVAYPTETFYGLGVDAFDEVALARLRALKGRGEKAISVLIDGPAMLDAPLSPRSRRGAPS